MSPSAKDNAPTWAHALAGQLAGMVGLSVVHPIDTVKIRVQAVGAKAKKLNAVFTLRRTARLFARG